MELALGVVYVGEDGADAGAALASVGGRVNERDLVELVEQPHRQLDAEREAVLLDAGVADVAFDQ